uniref:Uncharacterized protein n=1 Tax=Arundo donax TaxID=35708 RepID=A0A0A9HMK9_ARUDO
MLKKILLRYLFLGTCYRLPIISSMFNFIPHKNTRKLFVTLGISILVSFNKCSV